MCSVETGSCEASLQSENAPDHVVKSVDGDGSFCCPECGASLRILGCTAVARRNRITLPDWLPEVSPEAPPVASPVERYGVGAKHEPRQPSAAQPHRPHGKPHPPRPAHLQGAHAASATQTPIAVSPSASLPAAVPQAVRSRGTALEPNSEFVDGDEPTKVHTGLKLPDAAYAHGGEGADEVDIESLLESTSTPTPSISLASSETPALDNRPREEPTADERISNVDERQRAVHLSLPGLPALVAPPFGRRPVGVRLPELAQDRISRPTPTPLPIPGIFGGPIGVKLPDATQESGATVERASSSGPAAVPAPQDTIPDANSTTSASVPAQVVAKAADTERSNEPIAVSAGAGSETETGSAGEAIDPAAVTQRAPVEYVSQAAAPASHPALLAAAATATADPIQSAAEPSQNEPNTSAPSVSKPSSAQAGAAEDQKHVLSDAPFIRDLEPRRSSVTGRLGLWLGLAALCGGAFLLIRSPSRSPSASVAVHAATPLPAPAASVSAQQSPSAAAPVPAPEPQRESSDPTQANATEEDRTATRSPEKKPALREPKPSGAENAIAQAKPAPRAPSKTPEQTPDQRKSTDEAGEEAEPEQATFDASEAASALDSAAGAASSCRQASDPSGVAVVTITFAPSGRVTTATIAGPPFVGTATGSCIAAAMRRAKVPPFTGKLVTVRKTVTIQ